MYKNGDSVKKLRRLSKRPNPNRLRERSGFEVEPVSYYRILAVGLKFARVSGVMAPNTQGQGQTTQKANAPASGAFSGGKPGASQGGASRRVAQKGRDWRIEERDGANDAKYYDLRVFPGERGVYEILSDALRGAREFAAKHGVWIPYTMWFGNKSVTLVIGSGAILIRTNGAVPIARLKRLLEIAYKVNAEFDARDDGEEFNPPENGGSE